MENKQGKSKAFLRKSKIISARARPIIKSYLIDWAKENHKLLEKCKGKIAFKGRTRD